MLRSAASPGSVGFGRRGSGASGLLMTSLPAGHLRGRPRRVIHRTLSDLSGPTSGFESRSVAKSIDRYLILDSRNSTCFFATGSYFFFTSFSVFVREFFLVT